MKNIFLFLTLTLLVSCAKKDDAEIDIRKTISNAYPDIAIDEIKKIDENFHEIIINNQIYYATNDGKYLIIGNVIDLSTKESITENTKMNQRLSIINSIDMNNLMIFKPDKTNHILTIFTDTSCPYCQKLMNDKCKIVRHIRIHTGEKPYKCSQCNYASNQKESLKGHFTRMHC
jgi:thiol:disulfide interchange protein DsbC